MSRSQVMLARRRRLSRRRKMATRPLRWWHPMSRFLVDETGWFLVQPNAENQT